MDKLNRWYHDSWWRTKKNATDQIKDIKLAAKECGVKAETRIVSVVSGGYNIQVKNSKIK